MDLFTIFHLNCFTSQEITGYSIYVYIMYRQCASCMGYHIKHNGCLEIEPSAVMNQAIPTMSLMEIVRMLCMQ